jgi:hypothetical protein
MDVEIADDLLPYLNEAARGEFRTRVGVFAGDLIEEAGRLEATQRDTPGDPEITSTVVRDANLLLRKGYVRRRRSSVDLVLQLVSYVAAIGAGAGATALDKGWGQITFAACVLFGIAAVASLEIRR